MAFWETAIFTIVCILVSLDFGLRAIKKQYQLSSDIDAQFRIIKGHFLLRYTEMRPQRAECKACGIVVSLKLKQRNVVKLNKRHSKKKAYMDSFYLQSLETPTVTKRKNRQALGKIQSWQCDEGTLCKSRYFLLF